MKTVPLSDTTSLLCALAAFTTILCLETSARTIRQSDLRNRISGEPSRESWLSARNGKWLGKHEELGRPLKKNPVTWYETANFYQLNSETAPSIHTRGKYVNGQVRRLPIISATSGNSKHLNLGTSPSSASRSRRVLGTPPSSMTYKTSQPMNKNTHITVKNLPKNTKQNLIVHEYVKPGNIRADTSETTDHKSSPSPHFERNYFKKISLSSNKKSKHFSGNMSSLQGGLNSSSSKTKGKPIKPYFPWLALKFVSKLSKRSLQSYLHKLSEDVTVSNRLSEAQQDKPNVIIENEQNFEGHDKQWIENSYQNIMYFDDNRIRYKRIPTFGEQSGPLKRSDRVRRMASTNEVKDDRKLIRRSPLSIGFVSGIDTPKSISHHTAINSHGKNHHTVVIHPSNKSIPLAIVQPITHFSSSTVITHDAPKDNKITKTPGHGPTDLVAHAVVHPVAHVITHDITKAVKVDTIHDHVSEIVSHSILEPVAAHLSSTTVISHDGLDHGPNEVVSHTVIEPVTHVLVPVDHPDIVHDVVHIEHELVKPTHVIVPHHNVLRSHAGGFGVGIDFGGHGAGHGFFVSV